MKNAIKCKNIVQSLSKDQIKNILLNYADLIADNENEIMLENQKDLAKLDKVNPKYDRLLLNKARIADIINNVINIATYNFDVLQTLETKKMPSGITINKVRVPIGVVGIIYESRPNVTVDAFAICLKTQNICILKGSVEADNSNKILVKLAKIALEKNNINQNIILLMDSSRKSTLQMIKAKGLIDVCIPRGSSSLINFVNKKATVPVIETGAGVVHMYLDRECDIQSATNLIINAKTRKPSVCNSLDCLIINEKNLSKINLITDKLIDCGVKIYADKQSFSAIKSNSMVCIASKNDFGTEFLSLQLAVKTVKDLSQAIAHINKYSSRHSDGIVSNNKSSIEKFCQIIDSAIVFVNTSTAFADGNEFGMAAEIGISTQKLHTRGPFSLEGLTTYKWIVDSEFCIR